MLKPHSYYVKDGVPIYAYLNIVVIGFVHAPVVLIRANRVMPYLS
jgi:hypothetical protein